MNVLDELAPWRARIDALLSAHVGTAATEHGPAPARLVAAMDHVLSAPAKRLRPLVTLCVAQAVTRDDDDALFAACGPACIAMEMLHTYSLVHDDLPAMDDDAMRRGRPTIHIAFDEGTAVLAGDALLTDAFFHLAQARHNVARQVRVLALAAGSAGMVGGQHDDIHSVRDASTLAGIHKKKTALLFSAAAQMGALSVDADDVVVAYAADYGDALGLAFQIADDLLDVVSEAGKPVGRDARQHKATYLTEFGKAGALKLAQAEVKRAQDAALALGSDALDRIAGFVFDRAR